MRAPVASAPLQHAHVTKRAVRALIPAAPDVPTLPLISMPFTRTLRLRKDVGRVRFMQWLHAQHGALPWQRRCCSHQQANSRTRGHALRTAPLCDRMLCIANSLAAQQPVRAISDSNCSSHESTRAQVQARGAVDRPRSERQKSKHNVRMYDTLSAV